jgi:hypothetical protein
LLNYSPKPFSDRLSRPTIEAKHILVQIAPEVLLLKTALECPQDQPLDQGYDQVRSRQNAMLVGCSRHKYRLMGVAGGSQLGIPTPAIGLDMATRSNVGLDKRRQVTDPAAVDGLQAKPPQLAPFALNGNGDRAFVSSPTAWLATALPAQVKLIDFNMAREPLASLADRATAQLLQPTPGGLVASQPEQVLQVDGVDPGLAGGEPPQGLEPVPQRLLGAVQDRAGGDRLVVFASPANAQAPSAHPVTGVPAAWAPKPLRPSYSKQILVAGLLAGEALIKLLLGLGKIFKCDLVHRWPPRFGLDASLTLVSVRYGHTCRLLEDCG